MRKTACGECMHEVRLVPIARKRVAEVCARRHRVRMYGCTDTGLPPTTRSQQLLVCARGDSEANGLSMRMSKCQRELIGEVSD